MFCSKVNYFFAVLAWSALRRQRVQSDLLDGTAIQASTLVACTECPLHKEKYTYFALCFYFLGKLTRPRLVHCAHAAILRQTSPDHTHCRLFLLPYNYVHALACHCCTPRLMHFCSFITSARRLCFRRIYFYLSVCHQDCAKTYKRIWMKLCG